MNTTYHAGIIGLGFIGGADQVSGDTLGQRVENLDGTHFHALFNHPRIAIVGGSSRDAGRRERFVERHGRHISAGGKTGSVKPEAVYADWREMIGSQTFDIVSIATYTPAHAEITVACAEAGIPVIYCEKPIASTIDEAHRMIDACNASGSLLVINHNRRFNPGFRRLRELVAQGALGKLTSITTRWGSGRLGNVGTHIFDSLLMVTGRTPVAVSGTLDESAKPDCRGAQFADPGGWGLIRLDDGCIITVDAADYATCPMLIEINGTDGHIRISGLEISVTTDGSEEKWRRDTQRSSMDIAVDDIVNWLDARTPEPSDQSTNTSANTIPKLSDNPPFPYDPGEAAMTLETIIAFHASHRRNGQWVELPLRGDEGKIVLQSG